MGAQKKYSLGIIDPSDYSRGKKFGGSSGFVRNILPNLKSQQVTIFGIGLNSTVPWHTVILEKNLKFIPVFNLSFPSKVPMRLKCLLHYFRNRRKILNSGVDILYVHSPECCLPFLYKNKNIPIIYHQHGSANPVLRSKYAYGRSTIFRDLFEIIAKNIYKRADWIIAIDQQCFSQAVENGAAKKATLLMNAVNMKQFYPNDVLRLEARQRLCLSEDKYVIMYAGRLERTKGADKLLACIPFMAAQGFPFHIYLAGDGTYKSALEKYVFQNNYNEWVTFLGQVPHSNLPCYYNMADILVLPSEMEGVPMVILEALACGTPVVASKVGGIPDIVFKGVNGMVLDDLSPGNLSLAISNIHKENLNRQKIAQSVQKFSSSNFVIALDAISKKILDGKTIKNALQN